MAMRKDPDWYVFQEDIKDHFDSLGADAETNVRVQGVRTCHDVDVFIKTKFLGENITWVVEAKHWKNKVTKAQVLALRSIVDDIGADRGFIISVAGFQSGAFEAAEKTNVRLKTFDELKEDTRGFIEAEILKTYYKRLVLLEDRYWSHSKNIRIEYGLRHDIIDQSMRFTGQQLLTIARTAIMAAEERNYPIDLESFLKEHKGAKVAHNFQQLSMWLNLNLNHFEEKLLTAEWAMYKNGDYHPDTTRTRDDETTTTEIAAKAIYSARKDR
ncbi:MULTISPECIES: restriction endonuclease [Chromohalobacter]|uniref:restriction endonuclease n=1 Tax=Chromohalobacter TaxID=42054 RepID=UPI00257B0E8D|nr:MULTISPECIES: restriction endonuclease [Chromohalobacter]MDO0947098.1 restriction endonuclease [Chromohalobacter salexigens]